MFFIESDLQEWLNDKFGRRCFASPLIVQQCAYQLLQQQQAQQLWSLIW